MLTAKVHVSSDYLRQILAALLTQQGQAVRADEIEFYADTSAQADNCSPVEARYPAIMSDAMGIAAANEQYMKQLIRNAFEANGYKVAADGVELELSVLPHLYPEQTSGQPCSAVVTIEIALKLRP